MQNQSPLNFMSSFEFISILMSIVIGLGVTNLLAGAARRVLQAQPYADRRSAHRSDGRDVAAAGDSMVGHVQVEHRNALELRAISGAHHLGRLDVFDDGFSLSARFV